MNRLPENQTNTVNPQETIMKIRELLICMAQTMEVCLHTGRGEDSILFHGFAGAFLMLAECGFFRVNLSGDDCRPMLVFTALCLLLTFAHWVAAVSRRSRDAGPSHPRYTGDPLIMRVLHWNELTIKLLEGPLVLLAGLGITHFNRPLGVWLVIAGAAMFILVCDQLRVERRRMKGQADSVTENSSGEFRKR